MEPESISAEMQREESEISGEVRETWRGQGDTERVGIGKSGRIELDNLRKGTERVNEVLRLCRGLGTAQSFFESKDSLASLALAWMAQALALEADDEDSDNILWSGQGRHRTCTSCC